MFSFLLALQTRATVGLMKRTARRENKEERRESDGGLLSRNIGRRPSTGRTITDIDL